MLTFVLLDRGVYGSGDSGSGTVFLKTTPRGNGRRFYFEHVIQLYEFAQKLNFYKSNAHKCGESDALKLTNML
jgi:hypothetical protein